jgi:hypothetical protein
MSWLDFLPDISLPEHIDLDIVNIGPEAEGDLIEGDVVDGDQIDADYAIKSEGNIIPINEIERVVPGQLSGDAPIQIRDDGEELIIDPENLEDENEWEEVVKPGLKSGWENERAVSTRSAYPILLQAERNVTDEQIAEIKDFLRGKILTTDYRLLQSALTIDRAMNADAGARMSDAELKDRKRELAEKYHDAAYSLPSMCTSGYFDEGELFRQVYWEMEEQPEYDTDDYDTVFRKLISNKPFVAYARDSLSVEELTDIVLGKIRRLPNYDIPLPYIDIRGIGQSNHQNIRSAVDAVEEEYGTLDYDEEVGDGELIVRISADSITSE